MKKNFLSIAVLAVVIGLSSCGSSSFESDVRKMANMECKMQQLAAKDQSDEKVKKEMEDLKKEGDAFNDKMKEKYKKDKDDKAMEEKAKNIMEEVMKNCK
jgi:predicted transcriptional regulator